MTEKNPLPVSLLAASLLVLPLAASARCDFGAPEICDNDADDDGDDDVDCDDPDCAAECAPHGEGENSMPASPSAECAAPVQRTCRRGA